MSVTNCTMRLFLKSFRGVPIQVFGLVFSSRNHTQKVVKADAF